MRRWRGACFTHRSRRRSRNTATSRSRPGGGAPNGCRWRRGTCYDGAQMHPSSLRGVVEPLESRIAPATLLVSGVDLKVFDVTNAASPILANDLQTEKDAAS